MSFEYHRSPDPQERGLKLCPRKCLHIYNYLLHPIFGFMHVRIQTWFPFHETDWPAALTAIARSMNPLHDEIFAPGPWTTERHMGFWRGTTEF